MLEKIILQNYRGFKKHVVPLRATTMVVGRNNAGKSTVIEALKLVSLVANRAQFLTFAEVPDWLDMPVGFRGVSPSLKGIDFDFRNLSHEYGEPPTSIEAYFGNGYRIKIYLNHAEAAVFSVIYGKSSRPVISKSEALNLNIPNVHVLPPVGPLARQEKVLVSDYIRGALDTNLAPLHFRNQLNLFHADHFESFVRLAEDSWPQLGINGFDGLGEPAGSGLSLFIRDGSFVAEVGWVGHGLQAWLQMVWFLARVSKESTIILDEPDIYLHADLQRKLIRMLKGSYDQVILATHSIEMMAEVDPEDVLIIDKIRPASKFAASLPAVQNVIDSVGGVHNLQLARLWLSRRCVFVEGDDFALLGAMHLTLFSQSQDPLDNVPHIAIGGSGNWKHAIGASLGLKNAGDARIKTYCILDADYKPDEIKNQIISEAGAKGLQLHIWNRKEIENYLIVPEAIARYIQKETKSKNPTVDTVRNRITSICEEQKENVIDTIASEIHASNKSIALKTALSAARKQVSAKWGTLAGKLILVSGKDVLSALSTWSKRNYGVSFGSLTLARQLRQNEIDPEVRALLGIIEEGRDFGSADLEK